MHGSGQVHIGVRLAARHLVAAENAAFKKIVQAHLLEHHLDLEAVRAGGDRDAALAMVMQMRHSFVHAFDGGDAFLQAHIAALEKLLKPCVGQRLACVGFDGHALAFDRVAHKAVQVGLISSLEEAYEKVAVYRS